MVETSSASRQSMPSVRSPFHNRIWHSPTFLTAAKRESIHTAYAVAIVAAATASASLAGADLYAFKTQTAVVVNGFAGTGLLWTLLTAKTGAGQEGGLARQRANLLFAYMALLRVPTLIGCILFAVATRRTWSDPVVDMPAVVLIASVLVIAGLYGAQRVVLTKGRKAC